VRRLPVTSPASTSAAPRGVCGQGETVQRDTEEHRGAE
jgi:hypothetical protein